MQVKVMMAVDVIWTGDKLQKGTHLCAQFRSERLLESGTACGKPKHNTWQGKETLLIRKANLSRPGTERLTRAQAEVKTQGKPLLSCTARSSPAGGHTDQQGCSAHNSLAVRPKDASIASRRSPEIIRYDHKLARHG